MIKKGILSAIALASFSGSASADWSYHTITDKMSGQATHIAETSSLNTLNFNFPYGGSQKGKLTLRKHPRYGLDIMVSIEKGQILCDSYQDCRVTIRVDSNPPNNRDAVGASDNSSDVIFLRDPSSILTQLSSAKTFLVEFPVYQEGNVLLEFNTENLKADKFQKQSQAKGSLIKPLPGEEKVRETKRLEGVVAQYTVMIKQRIKRYWIRPASTQNGISVKVRAVLIPGGDVSSVSVIKSSGNLIFDRSVESAVYKAAPLPQPSDPKAASMLREFEFVFTAD